MRSTIPALFGVALAATGWVLIVLLPGSRMISWGVVVFGVLLIGVAVVIDVRRVGRAMTSRSGKFGIGTGVLISLFVAVVLLVNAISGEVYHRFDLTGLSRFTLTSQTREAISELDESVEIVSFFTQDVHPVLRDYTETLLSEYENQSERITVRNVDPEVRPEVARSHGIGRIGTEHGAVVVRSTHGRRQILGPQIVNAAEHAFTNAILEVSGTRQLHVYFLSDDGSGSIRGEYGEAADGLRDNLFRVGEVEFDDALAGGIPDNAAAVVMAGPREPWPADRQRMIERYLENGGRVLLLFDPGPPDAVREILSDWGISIEEGILIDEDSHVSPNRDNLIVPGDRSAFDLGATYFPGATATIPVEDARSGTRREPLVWTSPNSWLRRATDSVAGAGDYDEEVDRRGPLAVGTLVSSETDEQDGATAPRGSRLVAIGDSDFATDDNIPSGDNAALFLNSVNWLTEGDEALSVDRKALTTRRLLLTPEQARFLHISSIGLLPLLVLVAGLWVWWSRK